MRYFCTYLCLSLLGIREEGKEAICSQTGVRPFRFGVGHRSESHTVETNWLVGHFLGDQDKPCITVVDTPGTGDTEGRDCDHAVAIANGIKDMGSIETFLLLFKGTNSRYEIIGLKKLFIIIIFLKI